MLEGTRPPEDVQRLAQPLHERQLAGPVVRDREARMHEFFADACKTQEGRVATGAGYLETKSRRKAKRWA
jgi:hypothetical protein